MFRPTDFVRADRLSGFALALLICLAAAVVCRWLDTPLPWMIGPLFATAAGRMAGLPLYCPYPAQAAGQWAIGTALGLYFTPAVVQALGAQAGLLAAGIVFSLALGIFCAWLLRRMTGVDRPTAFFAMALGGASEMLLQGERHGGTGERLAAAHGLRILMVVGIIPFAFKFADVHGSDVYTPGISSVNSGPLVLLIALTVAGAFALRKMRSPNAWVLGPLVVCIALTGTGVQLSALPEWMVRLGQLLLGLALGSRFTPAFLRAAPRYMAAVAALCLLAMLLSAGFGLLLAWASAVPAGTAILAMAPGGIAEMSLTARTLQLGVPVVTAFHVSRLVALVLISGPLYRALCGTAKDAGKGTQTPLG